MELIVVTIIIAFFSECLMPFMLGTPQPRKKYTSTLNNSYVENSKSIFYEEINSKGGRETSLKSIQLTQNELMRQFPSFCRVLGPRKSRVLLYS